MTKNLENFFNLPDESNGVDQDSGNGLAEGLTALDEIDQALPATEDISVEDSEMDELAEKATDHFDNLMDLGMNVEPRFSAPIFDAASKLLGHAITAKNSKIDRKLRALDLDLKRRRVELQEKAAGSGEGSDNESMGSARELSRNELLEIIKNKKQD